MNHTLSGAGVVMNPEGQVLIVSRHSTTWSLPISHVETNEDPKSAAIRAIDKSSGIKDITYNQDLGSYDCYHLGQEGDEEPDELKTISVYLFKTDDQTDLESRDPGNPEARWVELNKVVDLLTNPKDKEFFDSISSQLG